MKLARLLRDSHFRNPRIAWDGHFEEWEKIEKFDNYSGRLEQTSKDYYVHEINGWTDLLVKKFRKNVRRQNICVRNNHKFHSSKLERKKVPKSQYLNLVSLPSNEIKRLLPDAWWPSEL